MYLIVALMKQLDSFFGTNSLIIGFAFGVDRKVFLLVVIATGVNSSSSPASNADLFLTFT